MAPELTPGCRLRGFERDAQGELDPAGNVCDTEAEQVRGHSPAVNGQEGGICYHSQGLHW